MLQQAIINSLETNFKNRKYHSRSKSYQKEQNGNDRIEKYNN